jgi:hypothetical protein
VADVPFLQSVRVETLHMLLYPARRLPKPRGRYGTEGSSAWKRTLAGRHVRTREVFTVKNPLDSIWGTVICGFLLTGILYYAALWLVRTSTVGS